MGDLRIGFRAAQEYVESIASLPGVGRFQARTTRVSKEFPKVHRLSGPTCAAWSTEPASVCATDVRNATESHYVGVSDLCTQEENG